LPDDTLVNLLRSAATVTEASPAEGTPTSPTRAEAGPSLPPELADHPRYRVLGLLGAGGMGAVYRAEHRLMERTVALKVISRRLTEDPALVERFRQEVKAAARL